MTTRGVRGAIQVEEDTPEAITQATTRLLTAILDSNPDLISDDVASVLFTLTTDLHATYPALAARRLPGWRLVPLLCGREISVPGGLPRCLRVLIHWNTVLPQRDIRHVYLGAAARLRPDIEQDALAAFSSNGATGRAQTAVSSQNRPNLRNPGDEKEGEDA